MDRHFLAYHSQTVMGRPFDDDDGPLNFYASKRKRSILEEACGNTVWVIEGTPVDGGTTYSLCGEYQPDRVERAPDDDGLLITGGKGKGFHPHISLNQIPWFARLLRRHANFSVGFSELKDKDFIDGFISLSHAHRNEVLSFDRFGEFFKSDSLSEEESSFLSLLVCSEPIGLSSVEAAGMLRYGDGLKNQIVANGTIARIGAKFLKFIGAKRPRALAAYEVISDPNLNDRDSNGVYRWRPRREIVKVLSDSTETMSTPWQPTITFSEGTPTMRVHIAYERNPVARLRCLQTKGYVCEICGFSFEEKYGEVGRDYAEVHHVRPLSGGQRKYSNIHDELIVVCSNCHSMIHRRKEPYGPDQVRGMLRNADGG